MRVGGLTEVTTNDCYLRQTSLQEQQLYDHLLSCVQVEIPSAMISRFRQLFVDGVGYSDPQIWLALEKIALSKQAEQEFRFILNRCCHILINRWQMQPHMQAAIPELVAILENPSPPGSARSRTCRRLRELILLFTETEQYLTLRRLAQVMSQGVESSANDSKPLGTLISRYPYLYEHCLLSEDSSYEHQQTVRQIQSRMQQKFEFDLSKYVTYQVRRAQVSRSKSAASGRIIQPVANPTLLSDRELGGALKHFVGKVESNRTYRDLAQGFLSHTTQIPSYKVLKEDLYEYLTSSIDPAFGKRQFNDRLYTQLKNTIPHSDSQKPSEFLLVRTCSQLLNFLVVESLQRPNHFVFVDLITNLGATFTTGLLLKIVLLCRKVKPYLEKRFSILYNHYESSAREGVPWLVKSLENLNVALSVHFGSADVSCLNQIM
ncbi:hypothetical protein H6F77_26035 [Microcoleus sp. FACHB-831]|nr:hypothetical protein [Microcoleus sp. FACHB-831]MBD1924500.1 hypothetical protein [Microcoleus sp. FACHB-831]